MKFQLTVTFRDLSRTPTNWQQRFNFDSLSTAIAKRDELAKHPRAIRIETMANLETWERVKWENKP